MRRGTILPVLFLAIWAPSLVSENPARTFIPAHRLTALGLARGEITSTMLAERVRLMTDSQTFSILRDPRAVAGMERVESPKLKKIFDQAEQASGISASLLQAMAFLESFGDPQAQSPTGPKGIMQISAATARAMGLRMIYATRYQNISERVAVKNKRGKTVFKTVKRKIPYTVFVRDERTSPERAIPAAAAYLARLEKTLGGIDWAVFAYHCGVGCVQDMQALAASASGLAERPPTVAAMFFGASPVWNQPLYEAIEREMERDYSPTYWFRVMRAQQLLAMYKEDRAAFLELANYYRYEPDPSKRAEHRLAVWLKSADFLYQNCDDIKRDDGKKLARAFDDPDFFGFALDKSQIGAFDVANREYYLEATPAAIGTLTYIAYETRRLYQLMKGPGEQFVPLMVTSLILPMDSMDHNGASGGPGESWAHCSGQVFDIDMRRLPAREKQALKFILDDMGWEGYLGFIEESPNSGDMHIGCSPSSREFFTEVFMEAAAARPNSSARAEAVSD